MYRLVILKRLGETDIPKESRSIPQVFAHLSPFLSTRLESKTLSPLALRCVKEHHIDQSTQVGNNQAKNSASRSTERDLVTSYQTSLIV